MNSDRVKDGLRRIISHFLKPTDYHALYPATVVAQRSSGNLDLRPDDDRVPAMTDVPIRYGIPCCRAVVRSGSRVLVGFENGSPEHPVATVWDAASIEKIILDGDKIYIGGDGDSAYPIARLGDYVECLLPPEMIIAGIIAPPPAVGAFEGKLTVVNSVIGIISSAGAKGMCE